jgi:hypothetical protein
MRAVLLTVLMCLPVNGSAAEPRRPEPKRRDKCKRQEEGVDFLSTRKLVPETMKVYPLNNYGAIQTGAHRFYAIQKGKPARLTETAQFTQVWKEENGQWRLARVLSYDHQLAQ